MCRNIPYFEKGMLKSIEKKDNKYIVLRYYDSSNVVTKSIYEDNDSYKLLLKNEYYKTLEKYLKKNAIEYKISCMDKINYNLNTKRSNIIIYTLGLIGILIPIIGIFITSNFLLFLGIVTLILGIFATTISGYNLKMLRKEEQRINFIKEYETLRKEYCNLKSLMNNTINNKKIIASINPVYDINLTKIMKK